MSNLHKDLSNDQIHDPKDFTTATNDTYLGKNSLGVLEWSVPAGAGAAATYDQFFKAYGAGDTLTVDSEFCLNNAAGNNEHKFTIDLGAADMSSITPKNMVNGGVMIVQANTIAPIIWSGWVYGQSTFDVEFRMYAIRGVCGGSAEDLPICLLGTTGTLELTGNTSPICFNVTSFLSCEDLIKGDVILITAINRASSEGNTFNLISNITMQ